MNTPLKINHLAVLVCVVLSFIIGFLWYGPIFGEPWMAIVGLDQATIEANPPGAGIWVTNLISSIAPLYLLAWIFVKLDIRNGLKGAGIAFLFAFCFNLLSRMTSDMFAHAPYELAWITGGFTLTFLTISGFVLGSWTKKSADE